MTANLLDDLLGDFLAPASTAHAAPTPANPAKAANREHPCGLETHSAPCEFLRISANPPATARDQGPDSQVFADHSQPADEPQSEQRRGFSQDSQLSQGVLRTCASEAGPELAAVAWTDADIARFLDRRTRLMRWGWSEAQAEVTAERMVKRDRESDDRRMCIECAYLNRQGRCLAAALGRLPGTARRHEPVTTVLQRCEGFAPANADL